MFKMNFKASVFSILFMLMFLAASLFTVSTPHEVTQAASYDKVLYFPLSKYPQTGDHIRDAIAAGHSSICTIDRGVQTNDERHLWLLIQRSLVTIGMSGRWQCVKRVEQEPM